jgi:hypothetical protein
MFTSGTSRAASGQRAVTPSGKAQHMTAQPTLTIDIVSDLV